MKMLNNRLSLDVTVLPEAHEGRAHRGGHRAVGRNGRDDTCCRTSAPCATAVSRCSTNAQIVDRKAFAFDLTINGSTNSNKLLEPRRHADAGERHARVV